MKKEDEPDFYKMDKENPLPPLEEIPLSASKMRGGHPQQQSLAMSPAANGMNMNMQRHRMFNPEGVGSHQQHHDGYGDDGYGMGGGSRSPVGGASPAGMRDPSNFKNMEFKPVQNGGMGVGMNGMGGMDNGMMGGQMGGNGGMMGGQMGSGQMGMNGQMGNMNGMNQMGMNGMNQMNGMGMMNGGMGNGMMGMNPNMMMGMNPMMQQQSQQQQMGQYGGMAGMGGMGGQMNNGMMNGSMMNGQMMNSQNMNMQRLRAQQMGLNGFGAGMPVGAGGDEGYGRMGYPQC